MAWQEVHVDKDGRSCLAGSMVMFSEFCDTFFLALCSADQQGLR